MKIHSSKDCIKEIVTMLKKSLILLLIIFSVFIYGCDDDRVGQAEPSINISNTLILQGHIKKGDIGINKKNVFIKDTTNGFNIKQIVSFLDSYKIDDIYGGKTINYITGARFSNYDYLPKLLEPYEITIGNDFEGTVHVFITFTSRYNAGSYTKRGNFWRDSTYGTALAEALKNTHSITHMSKNKDYPVGAQKPIVVSVGANPDSVRALMQAAKATKDPRLLVIGRTSSTGKVTITAFGKEEKIDAGKTYEWKFGEEQIKALRKFVVRR